MKTTIISSLDHDIESIWDTQMSKFSCAHPMNAYAWGQIQRVDRWSPTYLLAERADKIVGGMLILTRNLPMTPLRVAYAPRGPIWRLDDDETIKTLLKFSLQNLKRRGVLFLRIDPNLPDDETGILRDKLMPLNGRPLPQRWSYWNAPRDEMRVDLTPFSDPKQYFAAINSKTRNSIRKPYKYRIEFTSASSESELKAFYDIFRQFSVERGFLVRDYAYQKSIWDRFIRPGQGLLLLAWHKGKVVGGATSIAFGSTSLGMHLGVRHDYIRKNVISALYWETIKWCIKRGKRWISFGGSASPEQENFKHKLLGEKTSLAGYFDFDLLKPIAAPFRLFEFDMLPKVFKIITKMRGILPGN